MEEDIASLSVFKRIVWKERAMTALWNYTSNMLPKWLKKDTQDKKNPKNKQKLNVTWHLRILDNQLPETVCEGFCQFDKEFATKAQKNGYAHAVYIGVDDRVLEYMFNVEIKCIQKK